jgi:hypothetical protein
MLYRVEDANGFMPVRHVGTDRHVGDALNHLVCFENRVVEVCNTFNDAGEWLAVTSSDFHQAPLQIAAKAVARHEAAKGFPGLACNVDTYRIERRLGSLLADTVSAFSCGLCEAVEPGLTQETHDQFAGLFAELASLWRVARVGCFNADTRKEEPYFTNPDSSGPRLTFSGAAQAYGMRELYERHPDLNLAERQKLLNYVLQWLQDALILARTNDIQESKSERRAAACPPINPRLGV